MIDSHVHLVGQGRGCRISPALRRAVVYRLLTWHLGARGVPDDRIGEEYLAELISQADAAPDLRAIVLLALDGRYDAAGRPDVENTALLVPNDYCLSVCRKDARLWPAASINPRRADALDELDRVAEADAVGIKVLPNSQGFDPADPGFRSFWRRMAELRMPLLAHTGDEHTLPVFEQAYGDPRRLVPALEEGVTVIAAHSGTSVFPTMRETFATFLELAGRYPRLYGDLAALGNPARARYFLRLLARPELRGRLLYGSDFPVPAFPIVFAARLGPVRAWRLQREGTLLDRPLRLARALNAPADAFVRAASVLRLSPAQRAAIERRPAGVGP